MEGKVCQYHKYGFCKFRQRCNGKHFAEIVRVYQNVETSNNVKKDIPKTAKYSHQEMAAGMEKNVLISTIILNMMRNLTS